MKLISMTDFVLEQSKYIKSDMASYGQFIDKTVKYTNFLKQPLKLEMFIPYDENHGGLLKKPSDEELEKFKGLQYGSFDCNYTYIFDYNQAKTKVLFEDDFCIDTIKHHVSQGRTIEYLANFGTIELTENALKQLGL